MGAQRQASGTGCSGMTRSPDLDHVLLTRFNLPTQGRESLVRAQDGWLRNRVELFEKFCLPSVRAQSVNKVHWIIYFDPESPLWLKKRISNLAAEGIFVPIFRATVSHTELVQDLLEVVGEPKSRLVTTNLDNDDGLAVDFAERLQQRAGTIRTRTALYFSRGLILCGSRLYLRMDRRNAFCSVAESWDQPSTCWADWHNLLGKRMPVVEIPGPPAWLQVVHGRNVSNRVHGRLISPHLHVAKFPALPASTAHPSGNELRWEFLVALPVRFFGERVKSAAKSLALTILGRDGFNKAKEWFLAKRHTLRT